ncbi:hypothetical protein AB1Y20_002944 [Prymnesium parvum]|uniref:SAGA-associated factor 11 n=1 Tax=Prymnesium parvum TaxID=97485 RepID=A0AB34JCU2_PRYPA|mmetsp:Transcript_16155/g.40680  ORF Transcript_16155/g.40680 Transcript_16155/m.40680 type:complete len:161 (+) Transcript_16155:330-812(+)
MSAADQSILRTIQLAAKMHPLSACCVDICDQLVQDLVREVCSSCTSLERPLSPRTMELLEGARGGVVSAPLRDLLAAEVQASERCAWQMEPLLKGGGDIFGNHAKQVVETLTCTNCGTQIAANRFAPHLERCMLGKGRASARAARDMMRSSAESDNRSSF